MSRFIYVIQIPESPNGKRGMLGRGRQENPLEWL
ncbi:hypothetical protein VPHK460_0159 [Vibrio phage K460]